MLPSREGNRAVNTPDTSHLLSRQLQALSRILPSVLERDKPKVEQNKLMTIQALVLASLTIPAILAAGGGPSPLIVIPLKVGENYMLYLSARIDGKEFACSVDSGGGDRIYLDKTKAIAAGIQPTAEGHSAGPQAASTTADARATVTLEIGALKLPGQELVMQDRSYADFACVIGLAVLKQYVVELSYQPPALRVYDAARYKYSGPGHAIPFTIDQGNPFVAVILSFPKGDPVTAHLAMDTGGGRPAGYLTKSSVDKHGIMNRVSKAVPDFWSGMADNQPRVLAARLEKLEVGDVELSRPIFFLWQIRGFGGADEPDGLLCPDFLRRFKLIFDYPRQKLILEDGPHFGDEMPFDASGTLIYREGENPWRVFKIIAGSPAAEAGLKEGDTVLEFDGRPAAHMSMREMTEGLQADGRECSLRVKRGEEILAIKLKLRRLI
jgi:hypothetical protein